MQDTAAATTNWGDIGDWDVSGVKDFSYAFSTSRTQAGGDTTSVTSNVNAAKFVGTAISKWNTVSATSLEDTFYGAMEMNANLSGWNVAKVKTFLRTFFGANKFTGTGLSLWVTAFATNLDSTFQSAGEMNSDLSNWNVMLVTRLDRTFKDASKFVGTGLSLWITTWLVSLESTFEGAAKMNADLSGWNVANVKELESTFNGAITFTGAGLDSWNTVSANTLSYTFYKAAGMNADLSKWEVGKVTSLVCTFAGASKFVGTGLSVWITTSLESLDRTFDGAAKMNADLSGWDVSNAANPKINRQTMFEGATSLSSCNKRRIADKWDCLPDSPGVCDMLEYASDWASEKCLVRLNALSRLRTVSSILYLH